MGSSYAELNLMKRSIADPGAEEEAKKIFLKSLYEEVKKNYREYASNGGKLAKLPECVNDKDICPDDMVFTYNALRVLYSRYLSRNELGKVVETPSMVFKRVAEGFKGYVDVEKLYKLMIDRRFLFNSPTLFNMYCDGARGALSACYVTPVYDDLKNIMEGVVVQAMTFKYGGGQGFSFSNLRPRGAFVKGTGGISSGPLSFMKIYDVVTEAVKQGGKRRGANMGILHDWHPDIYNPLFEPLKAVSSAIPMPIKDVFKEFVQTLPEEDIFTTFLKNVLSSDDIAIEEAGFVQVKKGILGDVYLTNFNISIAIHDLFMKAVIEDDYWYMVNPQLSDETTGVGDYRIHYSISSATGLGRVGKFINHITTPFFSLLEEELGKCLAKAKEFIDRLGLSIDQRNPYAWRIKAKALWREIIRSAWESGDPGIVFIDNHNKWSPTPWLGVVVATNPCGEQPLYPYESCNLGSISIEKYITEEKRFELDKFAEDVYLAVDAMDAVIDLNKHPDERQTIANKFTRKIGLGIMGLADALAKLGYPYDSDEAVAFTLIVMAGLEVFSWKRSWELGKLRGFAPAFACNVWDWRSMRCVDEEDPEKLLEMHTPAFVKASEVIKVDGDWVIVKYHDISVPTHIIENLVGEARNRVRADGSVKLVKVSSLKKVLEEVFNVSEKEFIEALNMPAEKVVESPKHLLALAVFKPFTAWSKLIEYGKSIGAVAPRNTVTTTIAPTGSISIIAGTSSGIEPYFALVYRRRISIGDFLEVVKMFKDRLLKLVKEFNLDNSVVENILDIVSRNKGSLRKALSEIKSTLTLPRKFIEELENLAKLYPTTLDIDPWYHLAHQAAAQLYVDQSISKTINIPRDSTEESVETIFFVGWLLGLKGVTVYRDESKGSQVIYFNVSKDADNQGRKIYRLTMNMFKEGRSQGKKPRMNMVNETDVVVDQDVNSTCRTCSV